MTKGHFVRTSTRIRNLLIGVVSAAALTTGALAATAASASAATAAPAASAPGYGCYGYGCIGKSALAEGCSRDASTVNAISVYDGLRQTRVTLRLRYSPGCQSAWATVTDTGHPDGATFWIYDRGTHALEVASTQRAWFTRQWQTTRMAGVAKTKARACTEVHDRHGMSAPICTPFLATRNHSPF
jgi:opacity protein-like surface antigen